MKSQLILLSTVLSLGAAKQAVKPDVKLTAIKPEDANGALDRLVENGVFRVSGARKTRGTKDVVERRRNTRGLKHKQPPPHPQAGPRGTTRDGHDYGYTNEDDTSYYDDYFDYDDAVDDVIVDDYYEEDDYYYGGKGGKGKGKGGKGKGGKGKGKGFFRTILIIYL